VKIQEIQGITMEQISLVTIGLITGVLFNFTNQNEISKQDISAAIDNVQDMKEWMVEDRNNGVIEPDYAEYYIQNLDEAQRSLVNIAKSSELTK